MIAKILLAIVFLILQTIAFACRCTVFETTQKINKAEYIGFGKVVGVKKIEEISSQITVIVSKTFRGQFQDSLFLNATGGSCGVEVNVGEEYLFLSETNVDRCNYIQKENIKSAISLIECLSNFEECKIKFDNNEMSMSDFEIDILSNFSSEKYSIKASEKFLFVLNKKRIDKADFFSNLLLGRYYLSQFNLAQKEAKKYCFQIILSLSKKAPRTLFFKRYSNKRNHIKSKDLRKISC